MKITKFIHSCLLIEESGKKVLIDPGNYSQEVLDISKIGYLSYLLITHEHQDHMYLPLIKEILKKFPDVKVISNQSVAGILGAEGISVSTQGDGLIQIEEVPHEKVFGNIPPQNTLFRIAGKLTHPGDSYSFTSTTEVLALPVTAPWGSTTDAALLAEKLKPKVIVPIHDWHWNEKARQNMYKRLEDYFGSFGIKFMGLQTGIET